MSTKKAPEVRFTIGGFPADPEKRKEVIKMMKKR